MTLDRPRLRRCLDGLTTAVGQVQAGDASAAPSIRRLARLLVTMEGATPGLQASAQVVAEGPDRLLGSGGEALCGNLGAILDRTAGGSEYVHLLLVLGDPELGARLARDLTRNGYRVRWVPRGNAVADSLAQVSVDAVVVDLLLPDMDGRDLIADLADGEHGRGLPVIALGPEGAGFAMARTESLALGAEVFLPRSVEAERLLDELNRLTGVEADEGVDGEAVFLRRGPFSVRFNSRPAPGGSLVLVAFDGFHRFAEQAGPDAGYDAIGAIAEALAATVPELSAIGRWGLSQLVLSFEHTSAPEAALQTEAAFSTVNAAASLGEPSLALLRDVSGAAAPSPTPRTLDEVVREVGEGRLAPDSRVRLLRLGGAGSAGPDGGAPSRGGSAGPGPDASPVILLVEDDPVTTALVRHRMAKLGFETIHFGNGDAALSAIPGLGFHMAILDLNLPGVDGFQLVKEIRACEGSDQPRRPIVILSGMTGEEGIVRGLELGADDYVLKPFSPIELSARVRRLLPSRRPSS